MKNINLFVKKYKIFLIAFFIFFLMCFFLFLAHYPGIMTYDGNIQWNQVESGYINNFHPFLSTFALLLLSKLHNSTTIIYLYQIFMFSFIWGITCQLFYPPRKKICLLCILSAFFSFIPIYALYTFTMWKDVLYTYYLCLIGIILYKKYNNDSNNKIFLNYILGLLLFLVFGYRTNGKIVALLLILLILIFSLKKSVKSFLLKDFFQILITFVLFVSIFSLIEKIYINNYNKHYKVKTTYNYSTIMNYELWIIGEHLINNNITSDEDLDVLNNIISIDEWKKIYNPYLINSTNEKVNKKYVYQNQDKINKIFFKTSLNNLTTVIKHYLKADSLLINPFTIDSTYVYVYTFNDWTIGNYSFNLMETSKMPYVQKVYNKIINISFNKPFNYFYCPALILYISILMAIIIDKRLGLKKIYLILTPALLNTVSLLPINLAQDLRYVYINYLVFLIILSAFLFNLKKIIKKTNTESSNLLINKKKYDKDHQNYIAVFSGYYYPHLGGIERYIDGMMKNFIKLGYKPLLITSNYNDSLSEETVNGIKILRLPVYNIFKKRYPILKKNKEFRKVLKKLDDYEILGIIVNTRFHLTSHVGASYGKKHNIPVYLIEHGSQYVTLDNKFIDFFANRYEDFLTIKIKNNIKGFYGVSEGAGKWLKRFKIKYSGVWYNSIDIKQSIPERKKHKNINLLYAGRLIKQKGIDNILEAFEILNKKYKNIHIFIAGDGPEINYLKNKYKNKNIEFLGKLDYLSLCDYYVKTDIFLYPPLWPEGLPTSILEAGLMGCSVIGTDQGGITEIITNRKNGLICDGSVNGLVNSIKFLIENKDLCKKYADELHKTVINEFSWDVTSEKILNDMNLLKGKKDNK